MDDVVGLALLSAGALIVGGVVKGALGVGLPLVAVPLLALWLPAAQAIGLLAGVLADQLNLAQRLRQILFGEGRQKVEQCFGAA